MAQQTARHVNTDYVASEVRRKIHISIEFDGGLDQVYSTHDEIRGQVTLEHEPDAAINELTLTLEGACTTHVGTLSDSGPATGTAKGRHHFLKLQHPIDASLFPGSPGETGHFTIRIPFTFIVPEQILPGACNHRTKHSDVKPAHLLLPPTLEEDHYAKEVRLARISYAIRVGLSLTIIGTEATRNESRSFGIRLAPERDEQPPLGVYDDQHEYCLRRTLPIRSTFRRIVGELTAETSQPPCLHIDTQSDEDNGVEMTLKLTFVPTKPNESPPDITVIVSKLLEYTFFAAAPFEELPRPSKAYAKMMLHRSYFEDFAISARRLANVPWLEEFGRPLIRTNAVASTSPPSSSAPAKAYFTTSFLVPLTVPTIKLSKGVKVFPPSFHSCMVSRTHAIELEVHVKTNSTITLIVPIQLVAKNTRQLPRFPTLPAATLVQVDRVLSFDTSRDAPNYEEVPSHPDPEEVRAPRGPSQVDELPDYTPDVNLATGQMQRASANRHSVSTTYEVPEQAWQNVGTGIKWVYRKAKTLQERRISGS